MSSLTPDLFFSFRGRIARKTWWLGFICVVAAGFLGTYLFNGDSYDESIHAVAEAPTMAAFLAVMICTIAATALCVKRLNDRGRPRWLGYGAGVAGVLIVCGWGLGFFAHPLSFGSRDTLAFWLLAVAVLPVLVECAVFEGAQ